MIFRSVLQAGPVRFILRKQSVCNLKNVSPVFVKVPGSSCYMKFSTTTAVSTFALLLLSERLGRVSTPLLTQTRHHSDSDSDTEKEKKEKEKTDKETKEPPEMQKPVLSDKLKHAKAEAFWGLFVADSIAMPVHWYYNPHDIIKDHKQWLTGYVAPKAKHPSSILRLSNGDGSGRGKTTSKAVIGNVILHDKLKYWTGESSNNHYHQGMAAGDNTLNAHMALNEVQTMNQVDPELIKPEKDVQAAVLKSYIDFMTTPGSHNDTYAESFHRALFRDWIESGKPTGQDEIMEFLENRSKTMLRQPPDSQLAVIGCIVPAIPWILRNAHKTENDCVKAVVDFIKLTHPVQTIIPFVDIYTRLLHAVLNGKDLKAEVIKLLSHSAFGGPSTRDRILSVLDKSASIPRGTEQRLKLYQSMTSQLGMACYIEGALSCTLLLALEFHDDFEAGVLTNANCGGENCHRGAALGALLGAAAAHHGSGVPQHFKDGLNSLRGGVAKAASDMNSLCG